MTQIYRTQEEIINLETDVNLGAAPARLSDLRTAKFGTARRSEIIGYINATYGGTSRYWHDAWEGFLRDNSINDSKYIEEERGVFHRTSTYP